ncbi:TfoX/Sxy family protein [Dietzia sp. SLG310A2-38A2]|uniref:TfoX/Sxy family protein n=1 Tax=Dietzia sp. SLG310A2-38A2 TaxID=1630643 RepID=UPI0015FDD3CE|nr:TfoX/Sxy family protein [Dietzia sp. SLG310A2-38A2]MBB1030455.1 TfoX/Sxy family protein [Dietzia sp. SLG310A2-38A2]
MARTPPPPAQQRLIDRLRDLLADEPVTREISMFGGRCLMVSGKMLVSAGRDGRMLVRVDADRHDELIARPGAAQAEMGAGRDMGPGWISVSASVIATDAELREWLQPALDYNRSVTGEAG